ncbi:MAG: hypothetical protein WCH57_08780 [Verrucomicrobiota bacterium]
MTLAESSRLVALEKTIQRGVATFIEVGEALMEIRDSKLYRVEYATFEEYCKTKWGFSKTQANRLVQSAAIVAELTPVGVIPTTERQARPLTKLKEPEQQREAWRKAVDASPIGQPTAKEVEEAVHEVITPKPEPDRPTPRSKPLPPSDGLQYAVMAIIDLEKIQPDDSQRIEAGQKVIRWINENLLIKKGR